MEIQQIYVDLGGTPALFMCEGEPERAGKRATILFYHGLGACKETQEKELDSLARAGFLAVGIDNVGHGKRRHADFERRYSSDNPALEGDFLDDVCATAEEVPRVVDFLLTRGLAQADNIGIGGISMGGYIVYTAVPLERRIGAAVAILGSPRWKIDRDKSPHLHPERFFPTALLSQNAGEDTCVPPRFAREFHERLPQFYGENSDRIRYIEYPGVGHFMPGNTWNVLWERSVEWYRHFLRDPGRKSTEI